MRRPFLPELLLLAIAAAAGCGRTDALPDPVPRNARLREGATIGSLGVPFDVSHDDVVGPGDVEATSGRPPEIVAIPEGNELEVLFRDHSDAPRPRAFVVRLSPDQDGYAVTRALEVPMLDRIAGFALDDAGRFVVATAVDETLRGTFSSAEPRPGVHRSNVVRLFVLEPETAATVLDVDLDLAREVADPTSEPIVDPMASSTSRLAVGGGRIGLLLGHRTAPDATGQRSQKAIATYVDLASGAVVATSSVWASHSFDQRLVHDDTGFLELHLADAYPRAVVLARGGTSAEAYPLFAIKGARGEWNTRTRLGDVVAIPAEEDPAFGTLALFATESTTTTTALAPTPGNPLVAGSRDLALVRIRRDFAEHPPADGGFLDPSLPDALAVDSGGTAVTNLVRFLTHYQDELPGLRHAERPKLVAVAADRYVVLFERWSWDLAASAFGFDGTFGLVIDSEGTIVRGEARVTSTHLPRGDGAIAWNGRAAFVTGDAANRKLVVHLVDASLRYSAFVVD